MLACFGKQRKRAVEKYIDFVRAGVGLPPVWGNLKYQMYLGSDEFVESMRHKLDGSKKESLSEISQPAAAQALGQATAVVRRKFR